MMNVVLFSQCLPPANALLALHMNLQTRLICHAESPCTVLQHVVETDDPSSQSLCPLGRITTPPYFTSTAPTLYHTVACGEHCASNPQCQSYALGLGMCLHHASAVLVIFRTDGASWSSKLTGA
ncbi:hypothetical protein EJ03DRAFT_21849 [Teratosphaeria nubilosa]|uniref:Uncharacterized protein n=1 Tax=Teratosphaeria nubilosa TaxID=161662 RepID=A0A6G1LGH7_9PEZI|nr:hypothetical protein EJ03DRAFT_21849 [Teratosphaeria nubilosa]